MACCNVVGREKQHVRGWEEESVFETDVVSSAPCSQDDIDIWSAGMGLQSCFFYPVSALLEMEE